MCRCVPCAASCLHNRSTCLSLPFEERYLHKKRMLRRCRMMLAEFKSDKLVMPGDQMGRFNLDEAAAELSLSPDYVRALYKPLHYTFYKKGQRYPGERGRTTRPGAVASGMSKLFPLHKRNPKLHRELRTVHDSKFSTF